MSQQAALTDEELRARIAEVPFWYHRIELRPGIVTPGLNNPADVLAAIELPDRCEGMRVLDVGARDGFFAFELERRGADVVALDYTDPGETGFNVARQALESSVEYRVDNVYNVDPGEYGRFDLVLFLGVLYHLRDPLLALDTLWDVTAEGGEIVVETQLLDGAVLRGDGGMVELRELGDELPELRLAQFYPGDVLRGDPSNYWAPSASCMRGLLEEAGFEPGHERILGSRGVFHGRRVEHGAATFRRRLEKGTVRAARGSAAEGDQGAIAQEDESEPLRLQRAAEAAGFRERAARDELAAAKRHIDALESALAAKQDELASGEPPARDAVRTAARASARALRRRLPGRS